MVIARFCVGYPKQPASLPLIDELLCNKNTSGNSNENGNEVGANPNNWLAYFLSIQMNGNNNANGNIYGNGTEVATVLFEN